jgi:hypothetical protein
MARSKHTTSPTIPATGKSIRFDRETNDFILHLDGEFVGYAATYADGETVLDQMIADRLTHQQEAA